jgi:hypothetical protein
MIDELGNMWKESSKAYLEAHSQNAYGASEENQENLNSGWLVYKPSFETVIFRIQIRIVSASTNYFGDTNINRKTILTRI